MTRYRIQGPLVLGFIVENDQQDILLDKGIIESDGKTIWLVQGDQHYESITTPNVVAVALDQGLIIELDPESA